MDSSQPPAPVSAHREQAAILIDLAARLRRQGAGEGALRAALQERISALSNPALAQDEVDEIAVQLANTPPHLVTSAIVALGLHQHLPAPTIRPVRLHTAATIATESPAAVDWIAEPWAATGALTGITGRPKIGKTTFILDLISAFLDGRPFLNYPASTSPRHLPLPGLGEGRGEGLPSPPEGERPGMRGPHIGPGVRSVLYLTEQQVSSFRASLARSGLLGHESLAVMFWHESMTLSWRAAAALAGEHCAALGARLLVIDTLSQWAGMRGDMENQAGDAFQALQPLQQLAATGIAVVFIQHERKLGGDAADAGRGSSAFAGAVDTLISFRRPPHITTSNPRHAPLPRPELGEGSGVRARQAGSGIRLLLALSRFEAVPQELYIERQDGRYTVVGQTADFAAQNLRAAILSALSSLPLPGLGDGRGEGLPSPLQGEGPGMRGDGDQRHTHYGLTIDDFILATGAGRSVLLRSLDALLSDGEIERLGDGKKGRPHRYSRPNSFLSAI